MQTAFKLTERELIEGLRCAGSMTVARGSLYAATLTGALAVGIGSGSTYAVATSVALVAACVAHSLAKRAVILPRRARILYEGNHEYRDEQFVEFDAGTTTLKFGNKDVASELKLSDVSHWRRSANVLLIGMAHRGYLLIPGRLKTSGFESDALVASLEKVVGHAS